MAKDANILITGCGSGWMLIWLAQRGFKNLSGFDYLQNVVDSAVDLSTLAKTDMKIWQDDGFCPSSKLEKYDVITALYWVYSAWGGNYGNKSRADEDNQELLKQFLSNYLPHLSDNGLLFIELIDSIAEFQEPPENAYPIRHSMQQVANCAEQLGLSIEKQMFNARHRKEPKMLYILKKVA
ncbi:MAG TPA: methyltransferase domain-containing protein [Gemmatimonadetes bacterium]|nr:methyltransferase domain-containing protein [Gemmatimonadota bacterium]